MTADAMERLAKYREIGGDGKPVYIIPADELAALVRAGGVETPPADVFPAIEDVLAKHTRGWVSKPTTRENIAELIDRICQHSSNETQKRQNAERELAARGAVEPPAQEPRETPSIHLACPRCGEFISVTARSTPPPERPQEPLR